jgi:heme-degrading monooxygenase HmoA
MFASVIQGQLLPGKLEDASRVWRETIEPLLQRARGWRSSYVLSDENSKLLLVSFWESQADAGAVAQEFEGAMSQFGRYFVTQPKRELFDLKVHAFPRLERRLHEDN